MSRSHETADHGATVAAYSEQWRSQCNELITAGASAEAVIQSLVQSGLGGWIAMYGYETTVLKIEALAAALRHDLGAALVSGGPISTSAVH